MNTFYLDVIIGCTEITKNERVHQMFHSVVLLFYQPKYFQPETREKYLL